MKTIQWGIIGLGNIAERFATTVKKMDGVTLKAVASRTKNHALEFGRKYEVEDTFCYGTYDELINDDQIDAIYIAVPHPFHKENAIRCLNHGKAVLCEKPVTMNNQETQEVIQAAKENKVFFMEAMKSRFMPINKEIRKIVREGGIGEPTFMRAELGFKGDFDPKGRIFNRELGGGAVLDIGIYPISYSAYLLGNKPNTIQSSLQYGVTDVDENGTIQLSYDNGSLAQIYCTIRANTRKDASLLGTEGSIYIPYFSNAQSATITTPNKEWTIEEPFELSGFEYQIREVGRCLQEGALESPLMTWQDSLEVMDIVDQIFSNNVLKG